MILQSLCDYYARARQDPKRNLPPYGYAWNPVSYMIMLGMSGTVQSIVPLYPPDEKKKRSIPLQTPSLGKARASGIAANFLWDNPGYVFGVDAKGKAERARDTHTAFVELHERLLAEAVDPGLRAMLAFVRSWRPEDAPSLEMWETILEGTANNLVFRMAGTNHHVHEVPEAQEIWRRHLDAGTDGETATARCLVTGDVTAIAQLHPALKGVMGAQSSGAGLSTYNMPSSESFNKVQNLNAPVGRYAAFAYATALNHLLADSSRRLTLGDSTVVVWADQPSDAEAWLLQALNPSLDDDVDSVVTPGEKSGEDINGRILDKKTAEGLSDILKKLVRGVDASGLLEKLNPDAVFHLLCLAPNAARVSVRFHVSDTLLQLLKRSARHYRQLRIVRRYQNEPLFIPVVALARELAGRHRKAKDIQRLAADLVESIVTGGRYPEYLFAMAVDRIRAEADVTYIKAAMLKAILIRNHKKEISVSLNPESTDVAYQLGRLFALLEGVQRKAIKSVNASIRDRFYGAASSTPASVFPLLLKNAQHHISKGNAYGYDKLIGEVMSHIDSETAFPGHLSLERQGRFALGYYHQRYSATAPSDTEVTGETTEGEA